MPITSIDNNQGVLNFLNQLNLNFSKPQLNHLANLMTGIINIDSKRNISNISSKILSSRDRSCVTKFLNNAPWDVQRLNLFRIKHLLATAKPKAKKPVFIAIDDTVIPKNPDTKHIEGLSYHFSHAEGKTVWSHCIVSSQFITDKYSIPLGFEQYLNEEYCLNNNINFKSKIDLACDLIDLFKENNVNTDNPTYTLTDSWFNSKKLIDKSLSYGYHLIGGLKTNRCIYPLGIKISISKFVNFIKANDLDVVTVKSNKYKVYRYEGKVSNVDNAVVLICWESNNPTSKPKCILSTDIELESKTILEYYCRRWKIETSFLYLKDRLGLKHYQMRKLKGVQRFWSIVYLAYTYLELFRGDKIDQNPKLTLGDVIKCIKGVTFKELVEFIYKKAVSNVNLEELYEIFDLAV